MPAAPAAVFSLFPVGKSLRKGDQDGASQQYDQSYRGYAAVGAIQIVKIKKRAHGLRTRAVEK